MHSDIFPALSEKTPDRHRPVDADARLRFDAAACLPVRYPDQTCDLCVPACPVAAIAFDEDEGMPSPVGDCLGCGQCAAACPTAALQVDGFALPATVPTAGNEIHVDCWRVPLTESPAGALRVPCLAGIGVGWLLALFDRATTPEERPIRLLDRGGCNSCAVGPGIANLQTVLDETRALLSACGVSANALPAQTEWPSRQALTPVIPTSAGAQPLSRRGFFRGLMGGVVRSADEIRHSHLPAQPISLRESVQPIERMRVVTALSHIAMRHGRPVPAQALPQVSLAGCAAHGVCVGVCPTGALRRIEDGNAAELHFHAALCIACGQCAQRCPEQAMRFSPSGGTAVTEILARWESRDCALCGEPFFGADSDTCPTCSKHQQLFHGMAALHRLPA
jgi:ferredoxin